MSNVVPLADRRSPSQTDALVCSCGSEWFEISMPSGAGAFTLAADGRVTGYAGTVRCRECGRNAY